MVRSEMKTFLISIVNQNHRGHRNALQRRARNQLNQRQAAWKTKLC